jgi:hypothetical protein
LPFGSAEYPVQSGPVRELPPSETFGEPGGTPIALEPGVAPLAAAPRRAVNLSGATPYSVVAWLPPGWALTAHRDYATIETSSNHTITVSLCTLRAFPQTLSPRDLFQAQLHDTGVRVGEMQRLGTIEALPFGDERSRSWLVPTVGDASCAVVYGGDDFAGDPAPATASELRRAAGMVAVYFGSRAVTPRSSTAAERLAAGAMRAARRATVSVGFHGCADLLCKSSSSAARFVPADETAQPGGDNRTSSASDACSLPAMGWQLSYEPPEPDGSRTILRWRSFFEGGAAHLDASGRVTQIERLMREGDGALQASCTLRYS